MLKGLHIYFRYLLGDIKFLEKLIDYNVINALESRFIKLRAIYLANKDFNKDNIIKNSEAAANIFDWIKAIDVYQSVIIKIYF